MKQDYSISIYLDTRRAKGNGKYPVKLRVYTAAPRRQKLYPTTFDFSENEFNSIWNTTKPRSAYKDLRRKLQAVEVKANKVAEKLSPFTFEQFEKQLYRKAGDGIRVAYHFELVIGELIQRKQIGTASTYVLSRKSIIEFVDKEMTQKFDKLTLPDITPNWLQNYECYMVETIGRSLTTVSIYLRSLRAIFNKAIDENEIEKDYYPFGKRKYQVPATRNTKRALSGEQLKTMYLAKPANQDQQKAKDFWFLSYSLNGINIKDIALLRYSDIEDDKIEFYRAKTRKTSKGNLKPVTAFLNDYSASIIRKYGNNEKAPVTLVFDILTGDETPQRQHAKIKNFTRFINQHLKKLCKANGLPEQISSYWARHSYATQAVRNGATMEFIQESLGHGNISTTQNYFAGFDDETKKEFAQTLMNFN